MYFKQWGPHTHTHTHQQQCMIFVLNLSTAPLWSHIHINNLVLVVVQSSFRRFMTIYLLASFRQNKSHLEPRPFPPMTNYSMSKNNNKSGTYSNTVYCINKSMRLKVIWSFQIEDNKRGPPRACKALSDPWLARVKRYINSDY